MAYRYVEACRELGIAISVGVLAGLWTFVSVEVGLITWVPFIAWACFFAAGGVPRGLREGLDANLARVFRSPRGCDVGRGVGSRAEGKTRWRRMASARPARPPRGR
ncbi:MAG: DUF1097 domain-containing protein [Nocardioidaceae bacterium]